MEKPHVIYECGICGCFHPWDWDDDCRDDANRFGTPEDYIEHTHCDAMTLDLRSMDDRVLADSEQEDRRKFGAYRRTT